AHFNGEDRLINVIDVVTGELGTVPRDRVVKFMPMSHDGRTTHRTELFDPVSDVEGFEDVRQQGEAVGPETEEASARQPLDSSARRSDATAAASGRAGTVGSSRGSEAATEAPTTTPLNSWSSPEGSESAFEAAAVWSRSAGGDGHEGSGQVAGPQVGPEESSSAGAAGSSREPASGHGAQDPAPRRPALRQGPAAGPKKAVRFDLPEPAAAGE